MKVVVNSCESGWKMTTKKNLVTKYGKCDLQHTINHELDVFFQIQSDIIHHIINCHRFNVIDVEIHVRTLYQNQCLNLKVYWVFIVLKAWPMPYGVNKKLRRMIHAEVPNKTRACMDHTKATIHGRKRYS